MFANAHIVFVSLACLRIFANLVISKWLVISSVLACVFANIIIIISIQFHCDMVMSHCDNVICPNAVCIMFDFRKSLCIFAKITRRCWLVVD
jgi:hypothetical protein